QNGLFIVTERSMGSNYHDEFRQCATEVTGIELPKKEGVNVKQVFEDNGLTSIVIKNFQYDLEYSIEKYLLYMQSRSYWNHVPIEQREEVLAYARSYFQRTVKEGLILVPRHYQVTIGRSL
ncbi:MAG: hypothetical protein WC254_01935, partial [Candidatus Woesearchaeota archaeon]